jgi:hypothetical protein
VHATRAGSCSGREIQRRKRRVNHFHRLLNQVGMNGKGSSSGGGSGWFWESSLLMVSFIGRLVASGYVREIRMTSFILVRIRGITGTPT